MERDTGTVCCVVCSGLSSNLVGCLKLFEADSVMKWETEAELEGCLCILSTPQNGCTATSTTKWTPTTKWMGFEHHVSYTMVCYATTHEPKIPRRGQ